MNRYHLMVISTILLMAPCGSFSRAGDGGELRDDDSSFDNLLATMFGFNPDTAAPHETRDTLTDAQDRVFELITTRLYDLKADGTIGPDVFTRITQIGGDMNAGEHAGVYIAPDKTTALALHALADATDWAWGAYRAENAAQSDDANGTFRG